MMRRNTLKQALEEAKEAIGAVSFYNNGCSCCSTEDVDSNEKIKKFLATYYAIKSESSAAIRRTKRGEK